MATTKNSKKNVSSSKGVSGAYVFFAPASVDVPVSLDNALGDGWVNLGFVGEDGIVDSQSVEKTEHKDGNGDVVDTSRDSVSITLKMTLVEHMAAAQKFKYGSTNVTDNDGVLTTRNKGEQGDRGHLVAEMLLKNGRKCRRVYADVSCEELGEAKMISKDLYARECTCTVYKDDETGEFWVEYCESTETTKPAAIPEGSGLEVAE